MAIAQFLPRILERVGLAVPDGRALHGYQVTVSEQDSLANLLHQPIARGFVGRSVAQGFVLWASEHIRTRFAGGQLSWEFVFDGLQLPYDRATALELTDEGLKAWQRPLRRSDIGHREFLYSLLAEGGLPDLALAQPRYGEVLSSLIAAIEAEGPLGAVMAEQAALRAVADLPQVLQTSEQARLLADLALAIVEVRSQLPDHLATSDAESWLDANRPEWRQRLPIRLSTRALEALIRPALTAERAKPAHLELAVTRQLRRVGSGRDWVGVAEVADRGMLPTALLAGLTPPPRVRLTASTGAGFLAVQGPEGWELNGSAGRGHTLLPLAPHQAVVFSAHADGRALGEVMVDPGSPPPEEAPSLWRPVDVAAVEPDLLVPLSARGMTRAAWAFLLAPDGVVPTADAQVTVGRAETGPGGSVWPLSGRGEVRVGSHRFAIATNSDSEAPFSRLMLLGERLTGFTTAGDLPVFLGIPQCFGAEGTVPMRLLGRTALSKPLPRLWCGTMVEWVEDRVVLARTRLVVLPKDLRLSLRETSPGGLRLDAEGLPSNVHVYMAAGGGRAQGRVETDTRLTLELTSEAGTGSVELRLGDPAQGSSLDLAAVWPARKGLIVDPSRRCLTANRTVSIAGLAGWRGFLPGAGAIQLRAKGSTSRVAFVASGLVGLSAFGGVIGQMLTFQGADGRVNLRLVANGSETPRLEIGRYDWDAPNIGSHRDFGAGRVQLRAVCIDEPARTASLETEGIVELADWLGDAEGLWFIQGVSDTKGIMRPFTWSTLPTSVTTREERLCGYAETWGELIRSPTAAGWAGAWELIAAVRAAGDACGLDQVQALARVPAAAAVLVLRADRADREAVLALESEAPLWWPLVGCADWGGAFACIRSRMRTVLDIAETENQLVSEALARLAGEITALRPELAVHLGKALLDIGERPVALDGFRIPKPLWVANSEPSLRALAQDAAKRFDGLPQGVGHPVPTKNYLAFQLNSELLPLLDAPFVVAETAAGVRAAPTAQETLQLIALRAADPAWFDGALPAALALVLERSR